ncbi:hypothetical protein PR202_ga00531 [Eleusine coracana subsp. coracana]|uniref:Protein ENHANCED DISEASE RESISTANCE 2 C-terminal domain-containing protein n=1 Tax=Eleusine coracana subsp. coracana TaxID=191504 RepID=A0AAV5BHA7_ELECO|nr:hypothetical protein PR202_ga00531 [Eleusine coracana subsp. coracana]
MEFSSGELTREMGLSQDENECINLEMPPANESKRLEGPTEGSLGGSKRQLSSAGSFIQLNDAADEFFDVPDESEYDQRDMFPSDESTHAVDQRHGKLSTAAVFVKRLHDLAEKVPLLERFVNGDDAFRNSRFKLIPYISKGSWIVKQSVGKKACLVGQALEINYFRGSNYLELGVDIGSSTVARGVVSLVLGYLNNLVIEMAFLVQGNTQEELPEFLLGTCRLNYLDASKAVSMDEC